MNRIRSISIVSVVLMGLSACGTPLISIEGPKFGVTLTGFPEVKGTYKVVNSTCEFLDVESTFSVSQEDSELSISTGSVRMGVGSVGVEAPAVNAGVEGPAVSAGGTTVSVGGVVAGIGGVEVNEFNVSRSKLSISAGLGGGAGAGTSTAPAVLAGPVASSDGSSNVQVVSAIIQKDGSVSAVLKIDGASVTCFGEAENSAISLTCPTEPTACEFAAQRTSTSTGSSSPFTPTTTQ